jgi:hypothetical protein
MSLEKIQQLVGSLAKSVEDNEKLATPILSAKLAKCLEAYPGDQTIGSMARVISKMASNNTLFIRKADFKSLYHKLHSRNTKFAQLFQEELGVEEHLSEPVTIQRDEAVQVNAYEVGDQILANALNSVFDKQLPLKMYSQALADKAQYSVASTLDAWSLKPSAISVADGSDKFLVIKADYETPKGITSFYVPVEVHGNKVVEASVFMGNTGPQDLNHSNLKSYLTTYAGTKLKANGTAILSVLTSAASENREISDAEIALTKLNATRQGKSEFFQNQIVGQKVSTASVKDVELPKYDEFTSFEKSFTTPYGVAAFQFGADNVKIARENISRELIGYGYKNPQITVTGSDDNTLFYGVSLDAGKVAFTVPVKVASGKLNKPNIILCNGSVAMFSKDSVNDLYVNNQSDYKVAAAASPQFGLKPSDLINNIKQAIAEGNNEKAEDALNVLANTGDTKAYAYGFQTFLNGLSGKSEKKASDETCCSMIVKSASSQHPVCGHTGLPLHKVYQDKDGNCRPAYRKGMDESYEGAVFNNHKIFG